MKKIYLFAVLIFHTATIVAQNAMITGQITGESNEPLIGATIIATHTTSNVEKGTSTDVEGNYVIDGLKNDENYTLKISYIGFRTKTIANVQLQGGQIIQNITLKSDASVLGEIQVTARKRIESVYEVPISLSAFAETDFRDLNIRDMFDIGKNVPNFTVNNFGNGNLAHAGLFIRGIGVQDHWITTDPGVGAYLDGVYLGRQMGANLSLLNIKQVEVARGPQGTLFGRNSLGGAVNFITRKPLDDPYTKIQLTGGTLGRVKGEVYTSHKLSDQFGISLSGSYNRRGGVGEFVLAERQSAEIGEIRQSSFRGAMEYKPSEKLSFFASFDYSNDEYGRQPYFLELYPGSFLEGFEFANDPYDSGSLAEEIQQATYKGYGLSFTTNYEINDNNSLKFIASRRKGDYTGGLDLDGTITFTFPEVGTATQNSFELQYNTSTDKLDFVAGIYAFSEEGEAISDFDFGGGNNRPLDAFQETNSQAIYGHASYDLSDNLSFGVGLRYTLDNKKSNAALGIFGDASPEAATRAFGEEDWNALTWDFSLNYKLGDKQSIYGLVSRGYQNGGFPARAGFGPLEAFVPYDEQYATNFEIGYKGQSSNAQIGLSAFYVNYTDLQLVFNEARDNAFISITNNAGESRSFGLELDGLFKLGTNFKIRTNIGYLDSEVTQIDEGVVATKVGDIPFFSPKLTTAISPQYYTSLNNGSFLKVTLNYSYRSSMFGQSLNNDENKIEARSLVDVSIAYNFKDPSWEIELYGVNIFDETYENAITDNAGIMANQVILSNDRREMGIKLIKTFGKF